MNIHRGRKLDQEEEDIIDFVLEGIEIFGDLLSFAEYLGWNRKEFEICNNNNSNITPNGTRREKRISSGYILTEDDFDPVRCIMREIRKSKRLDKIEQKYVNNNISKEELSEKIRIQNHNKRNQNKLIYTIINDI